MSLVNTKFHIKITYPTKHVLNQVARHTLSMKTGKIGNNLLTGRRSNFEGVHVGKTRVPRETKILYKKNQVHIKLMLNCIGGRKYLSTVNLPHHKNSLES